MQYTVDGKFKFDADDLIDFREVTWGSRGKNTDPGIVVKMHSQPAPQYTQGRNGSCLREQQPGEDLFTGVEGNRLVYYPRSFDTIHYGGSYVVAAPESGIGIAIKLGKDESGMDYFMQTKQHYSSNPHTMAVYASFWIGHGEVLPFAKSGVLDARAGQGIWTIEMDDGNQLQQKMAWELTNSDTGDKINYSINTVLAGYNEDKETSRIWHDPNTNNMIVGGVMNGPDTVTLEKNGGFSTWHNIGQPTTDQPVGNRVYQVQVTWEQFMDSLDWAANLRGTTVEDLFGSSARNPNVWRLTKARFAQEAHNLVHGNMKTGGLLKTYRIKGV